MKKIAVALVVPLMLTLNACTDNIGADYYNTSATGQVTRAVKGTIIAVRPVVVSDGDGQFGKIAGAAAGGVAGSMIGGSDAVQILEGSIRRTRENRASRALLRRPLGIFSRL